MKSITIIKKDYLGNELLRYSGTLVEVHENQITVEAYFDREDTPVDKIFFCRGDKFIEKYYTDRWFNIFEIQDQESGLLKAWYCNIGYPAEITKDFVSYRDLALDLLVYPDGKQIILDEDEFSALPLPTDIRSAALQALHQLQERFLSSNI